MLGIELTPEHPVDQLVGYAQQAEAEGFDTVFASHHYNNRDGFAALTAMARATDEILLGPGVVNPYETHPVALASRMATLQEVSEGRGVFGVGAGDRSTLANLGIDRARPLRRVLETVRVARQLWAGDRVDHDGTFLAREAGLNYQVGSIPVYVGAQGPDMLRMAATHADGVLYNGAHPRDVAWAAERVAEGRADRADGLGNFDFAVYASVSVADSADAARAAARPPVAFIAAGAPQPVLERHDLDVDRAAAIGEAIAAGDFDAAFDRVSDAMLAAFCVAGTPATVSERLAALAERADSVVLAAPLGPDLERAISLAGTSATRGVE
jgi:5,10-methylenetetrahydromethanopterin reductase